MLHIILALTLHPRVPLPTKTVFIHSIINVLPLILTLTLHLLAALRRHSVCIHSITNVLPLAIAIILHVYAHSPLKVYVCTSLLTL